VKVLLKTKFTVTPEGAIVNRTLSMTDGGTSTASGLPLSQSLNYETVKVPCGPVGNPVSYRLGNIHYTPKVDAVQQPVIQVGLTDPVLGAVETPALVDSGFGPAITASPSFDLTGSGHTTDLGYALANNVAPSVSVGSFSGKVGVPVAFSASVSGRCDIASLRVEVLGRYDVVRCDPAADVLVGRASSAPAHRDRHDGPEDRQVLHGHISR
jgi:hypothetical protein